MHSLSLRYNFTTRSPFRLANLKTIPNHFGKPFNILKTSIKSAHKNHCIQHQFKAYFRCHHLWYSVPQDTVIIIIIYFYNIHFFHAQLGSDVFPDMRSLHISLNTTHSECKPSSSISSSTHSLQVFLPLPTHLTPATTTFLQAGTQSSPLLRSTCPNHLNLPRLTTVSNKNI